MKYFLLIIITLFIFTNCSDEYKLNELEVNNSRIIEINISDIDNQVLNLSEVIDPIKLIKLQTPENALIHRISSLSFYKNHFFILDIHNKDFMVFNDNGKFICKIGNKGKGPGYYLSPLNFTIDSDLNRIYLYDGHQSKILIFNLKTYDFISEKKLDFPVLDFHKIDSNMFVFNRYYFPYYGNNSKIEDYMIYLGDISGNIFRKALPFQQNINKDIIVRNFSQSTYLTKYNNEFIFRPSFCDTIFSINSNTITAKYVINLGKYRLDVEKVKLMSEEDFLISTTSKEYLFSLGNVFDSDSVLYFELLHERSPVKCFYNKFSGQLKYGIGYKNDLSKGVGGFNPISNKNDTLICAIESYQIEPLKEHIEKMNKDEHTTDIVSSSNIMDNPVLILYKFKTF